MMKSTSLAFMLLLGIGNIHSARTQDVETPVSPPCPPPGLETVMSTQEECNCFYAFVGSDVGDYQNFWREDAVLHYPAAGKYSGPDGIAEYTAFATNGVFVSKYSRVGDQIILDVTSTSPGQCKMLLIEQGNWHANSKYTVDNKEGCASTAGAAIVTYNLTGNSEKMISVSEQVLWLPDLMTSDFFPLFAFSTSIAEYVCDQIVNTCKDYSVEGDQTRGLKLKKVGKKGKNTKKKNMKQPKFPHGTDLDMETCVKMFNELPDLSYPNNANAGFLDGNSKGCRAIHAFLASSNDIHCPHITFEAEEDINGQVKCNESAGILKSNVFTEEEIGKILFAAQTFFGFDESAGIVRSESCPN